ncbi:aspartic proteinase Asp1-like isoform X2 [Miscanthus floridulus]|uniref:aspartic proteinase Asp1-like isoform X2 n=1 Tax=Miscanthus floridulus TaxID=154761 RepID=UPI00345AC316
MAAASRWNPAAGLLLLLLVLLSLAANPSRAATPARSSTAVFQLQGDVYPTGHYYVTMNIGNPAKPYFLDVDTGSDLTWLQCDGPCRSCNKVPHPLYRPTANSLVPCANALCTALHSGQGSSNKCPSPKQCDYQIKYTDSASSQGVLINDNFSLPMRSSNIRPGLTFGCGYDQQVGKNGAVQAVTDGMLGLGRGSVSLVSQLKQQGITKNVLGHCLSTNGGGFLFFGDDIVPTSRVTWVPMARTSGNYYSPGSGTLYFDRRSLGVKPMEVVFDSGSTYTYFTAQPYQAVVSALKGGLSKSLKQVSDPSLPLCWKGPKAFKSVFDVKKEFKSLFLSFASAKNAVMEIPPENYLIVTKNGNVCLGILDGTAAKLSFNVIGDITMQDQMVIYDNEKSQLGWARGACTRSAKSILSSFP